MITKAFSGGWYADCLPSGPYVVLIEGSHLDTDLGRVDFLAGAAIDTYEPLFVRLSDDGRAFAGQSHFHTSTVEYTAAGWRRINKEAIGVSPIIYDQANQLRISDGSIGSQGWRYVAVDGELITGDATYAPGPGFTLYEWTDLSRNGDTVIIGQGPEDGCHVWDGTAHRVLATGHSRFVRAHRVGDHVSVAIWRTGAPTLLIWATVDELRALPVAPVVVPPPVVPPVPPINDPLATLHIEAIASAVVTAYETLLNREPDIAGYNAYVARLSASTLTVAGMETEIRASHEYKALPVPGVLTLPTLSIVGKQFREGIALWVPRLVSGLTLLVRTPAEQAAFLDWAVATGFNGVRVFAGALTWAGQTPDGARAVLPALLDLCAARGLAAEVTAITDSGTGYDAKAHLAGVVGILRGRRGVLLELGNEVGHPSQADNITAHNLREWGRELVPTGLLWAVGAASVDEPDAAGVYPTSGGTYSTAHLDRGRPTWNNVRRVREIYAIVEATRAPAIDNEPMGADELAGSQTGKQRWNDPALFFALGALDRGFGVGGVHHSQAGLMGQLPGPVQQACADAYVAAQAAIESVLRGVVGQYKNVGHAGGPFASALFVNGGSADGVIRAYAFLDRNRGVAVLLGLRGDSALEWANGWRLIRTVGIRTAEDGRQVAIMEIGR